MLQLYAIKIKDKNTVNGNNSDDEIVSDVKPYCKTYEEMKMWLEDITGLIYYGNNKNMNNWYGNSNTFTMLQDMVKELTIDNEVIRDQAKYFYDYPQYEEYMGYKAVKNIAISLDLLFFDIKDLIWKKIMIGEVNNSYYSDNFILWKDTINIYKELSVFFKKAYIEKKIVMLGW